MGLSWKIGNNYFSTWMGFLGSVSTVMKSSGLSECLQLICGENAVMHIISSKAVSWALRSRFPFQSELFLKLVSSIFLQHGITAKDVQKVDSLYESFIAGEATDKDIINSDILENVKRAYQARWAILPLSPEEQNCGWNKSSTSILSICSWQYN